MISMSCWTAQELTASVGSTSMAGLCLIRRSRLEVTGRHAADTRSRTSQCQLVRTGVYQGGCAEDPALQLDLVRHA
jgi:hypothetical protein